MGHPLLGTRLRSALSAAQFERELSLPEVPWLADHRIRKAIVMPAAGYLEMGLAALHELGMEKNAILENVVFKEVLLLPKESTRLVQVVLHPEVGGKRAFEVFSGNHKGKWTMHVHGQAERGETSTEKPYCLETIRGRCSEALNVGDFYAELAQHGFSYGPCFRSVVQLWSGAGEALGRLHAPAGIVEDLDRYRLHPVLLDGAFHVLAAVLRGSSSLKDEMYVPVGVQSLRLYRSAPRDLWAFAALGALDPKGADDTLCGDVTLLDGQGNRIAEVKGLRLRRIKTMRKMPAPKSAPLKAAADCRGETKWEEAPTAAAESAYDLDSRLKQMPAEQRQVFLTEELAQRLAQVTHLPVDEINHNMALGHLGLDSLMLLELKRRIEQSLNVSIPTIRLFENPSLAQLSVWVLELIADQEKNAASLKPHAKLVPV